MIIGELESELPFDLSKLPVSQTGIDRTHGSRPKPPHGRPTNSLTVRITPIMIWSHTAPPYTGGWPRKLAFPASRINV